MYTRAANKVVIVGGTDQFTFAAPMAGGNAVEAAIVVVVLTGGSLIYYVEGSNDRQNWVALTAANTAVLGFNSLQVTAVAWQYVRVRMTLSSGQTAIYSIGLNTAQLG